MLEGTILPPVCAQKHFWLHVVGSDPGVGMNSFTV